MKNAGPLGDIPWVGKLPTWGQWLLAGPTFIVLAAIAFGFLLLFWGSVGGGAWLINRYLGGGGLVVIGLILSYALGWQMRGQIDSEGRAAAKADRKQEYEDMSIAELKAALRAAKDARKARS